MYLMLPFSLGYHSIDPDSTLKYSISDFCYTHQNLVTITVALSGFKLLPALRWNRRSYAWYVYQVPEAC